MAVTREVKIRRELTKLCKESEAAKQIYDSNYDRTRALERQLNRIRLKKQNDLAKTVVGKYIQINNNVYAHVLSRRKSGDRYIYTCTTITFNRDGSCDVRTRDKLTYIQPAKLITEAKFLKVWNDMVDELNKGIK